MVRQLWGGWTSWCPLRCRPWSPISGIGNAVHGTDDDGICTNSTGGEQMSRSSCTTIRECCPPIHKGRPARPPASADTAAHAAAPIRRCDYVALVSCPSSGAAVSQARRERSACLPRLAWGVVADRELLEATLSSYHRVRVQHIGLHPLYPLSSRAPCASNFVCNAHLAQRVACYGSPRHCVASML